MIESLFGLLSENIWDRIHDSNEAGIRQGEESITDNILLALYRAKINNIHTLQTPKITESLTGCDWEWWIGSETSGWNRYAIQAKKVRSSDGYYPSLNHTIGGGDERTRQIDVLLAYAETNNAIPLYCFYNYIHETDDNLKTLWRADFPFHKKQFGWTYIPAQCIKDILDTKIKKTHFRFFEHIHSKAEALPMRSLVREHFKNSRNISKLRENGYFKCLPDHLRITDENMVGESSVNYVINPKRYEQSDNNIVYREAFPKECYDKDLQKFPRQVLIINTNDINLL